MKDNSILGKFVKTEWIHNEGFKSTWLRRINRETKTQYISDVLRNVVEYGVEPRQYEFESKWAKRYNKLKDGGFEVRGDRRQNPDGYYKLTVIDLISQEDRKKLLCRYSYNELFKTDLRVLQPFEHAEPKGMVLREFKRMIERKQDLSKFDFTLEDRLSLESGDVNHWNRPLIEWLENMFKVPVYYCYELISEHYKQGKLTESTTYIHINHFGGENKFIGENEDYYNRTIKFWLFEDKLVFAYADGMGTH